MLRQIPNHCRYGIHVWSKWWPHSSRWQRRECEICGKTKQEKL